MDVLALLRERYSNKAVDLPTDTQIPLGRAWQQMIASENRTDALKMTQELIANMLGVRRSGVTEAALKLQDAGLIRYGHGHIEVLDRPGLEKRVCECYGVVKREFDRLLPDLKAI
jgi:CRP-like cAMP-binding protein